MQNNVQQPENQRFCFTGSDYCVKLLRYVSLNTLTVDRILPVFVNESECYNGVLKSQEFQQG